MAIKRIANNDDDESRLKIMVNEILTGILIGGVTGIIIWILVGAWKANFVLGFVVGIAMFFAIIIANLVGCLIPMIMEKFNVDSGALISTLSDVTSLLIYFLFAQMFLQFFIGQ